MTMTLRILSPVAEDVVERCARRIGVPVHILVEEFEALWSPEKGDFSRKFVEYCSVKALADLSRNLEEEICNGTFGRFTFDMMLAWELPTTADEESHREGVAKEKEDRKTPANVPSEQDEIPLFYSDIMPLLVDNGPDVEEDTFMWLGSLFPLAADPVNGRFIFETLTAPTSNRLHFPAYDKFLREIDKCVKHLRKQAAPKGVELADDELILHVEGTSSSQRVARRIGARNLPGRLTFTNYCLYFEPFGVVSYEEALRIDLSKDVDHCVKPAATGPWGAPLFDKAIVYESAELSEPIVLEFPEMTSSTRRDHWLALMKEIILLHRFLSKHKVEDPIQAWEMHARTILGIIRLHAARELLRITPPAPAKFLIFDLCEEIPKGDYIQEELAQSLKTANGGHLYRASFILWQLNMTKPTIPKVPSRTSSIESGSGQVPPSLDSVVNQAREEEKQIADAKATTEQLKEEGIGESVLILMELLKPFRSAYFWFKEILAWKRPTVTMLVLVPALIIIYKEWVSKALAAFLLWVVQVMVRARLERMDEKVNEVVVCAANTQSTTESIVSAQQGLHTVYDMVQNANITLLKIRSIFISKAHKHAAMVMAALTTMAVILAAIPTKYIVIATLLYCFLSTSEVGKRLGDSKGERRLKEWWDSIPVIQVRVENNASECPSVLLTGNKKPAVEGC